MCVPVTGTANTTLEVNKFHDILRMNFLIKFIFQISRTKIIIILIKISDNIPICIGMVGGNILKLLFHTTLTT